MPVMGSAMTSLITMAPSVIVMLSRYFRWPSSVFSKPGLYQVTFFHPSSVSDQLSSLAMIGYFTLSIR